MHCGTAKGRLRAGQLCNECFVSEEVVKTVVNESSMNSILSKDHKTDYGDLTEDVLNTSLMDLTVVGLVNIIKLIIANVEKNVIEIQRESKEDGSGEYVNILFSHQFVESLASKERQNNLIITEKLLKRIPMTT